MVCRVAMPLPQGARCRCSRTCRAMERKVGTERAYLSAVTGKDMDVDIRRYASERTMQATGRPSLGSDAKAKDASLVRLPGD